MGVWIGVIRIEWISIDWENEDGKILTSSDLVVWTIRRNEFDQVTTVMMAEEGEEIVVHPWKIDHPCIEMRRDLITEMCRDLIIEMDRDHTNEMDRDLIIEMDQDLIIETA